MKACSCRGFYVDPECSRRGTCVSILADRAKQGGPMEPTPRDWERELVEALKERDEAREDAKDAVRDLENDRTNWAWAEKYLQEVRSDRDAALSRVAELLAVADELRAVIDEGPYPDTWPGDMEQAWVAKRDAAFARLDSLPRGGGR